MNKKHLMEQLNEISETLQAYTDKHDSYTFVRDDGKRQWQSEESRESYLEHLIEWSITNIDIVVMDLEDQPDLKRIK